MKLELEWDETKYTLSSIHAPDHSGRFPHDWVVYMKPIGMGWQGGQGHGKTLQSAADDMIRQLEERLARKAQSGYNTSKPAIVLDVNFDF